MAARPRGSSAAGKPAPGGGGVSQVGASLLNQLGRAIDRVRRRDSPFFPSTSLAFFSSTSPSSSISFLSQAFEERVQCDQDYLMRSLPSVTTAELTMALQQLLNAHQARVVRGTSNELAYQPVRGDVALALSALEKDEMLVYRLVEAAQREGIWAKTLKTKANLSRTFPKVIKHLETKKLVKCFKSITSKYKKIYIIYDLGASRPFPFTLLVSHNPAQSRPTTIVEAFGMTASSSSTRASSRLSRR